MSGITLENLKARSGAPVVRDYVWYDISDSTTTVLRDVSGVPTPVPITDISRNQRYLLSSSSGPLALEAVDKSSDTNYVLKNAFNLIDDLFTDQGSDPYFTSYETNYRVYTQTAAVNDISMSVVPGGDESLITLNTSALKNNSMTLHLDQFDGESGRDLSENFRVVMDTELDFFPEADVHDISNNMNITMHYFGIDDVSGDRSYQLGADGVLDLSCNALTNNAVLKFVADANKNDAEFAAYPKPTLLMANMLPSSFSIGAGRSGVSVPVTVPSSGTGLKSGAWNWLVTIEDGDYVSEAIEVRVVVVPKLSAPLVTIPALNFSHDISKNYSINVKYLPADIANLDISAWNPFMTVSMSLHNTDKTKSLVTTGSSKPFDIVSGGNDMDTKRTLDASANFTLQYSENRYTLAASEYILRLTYDDDKTTVYEPIEYPVTITGVTHNDKVTVTNNYDKSWSLSGGNKKVGEYYVYRHGVGAWTYVGDTTSADKFTAIASNASTQFGVTDVVRTSSTVADDRVFARSKSVGIPTTNAIVALDISSGAMFGAPTIASVIPIIGEGEASEASDVTTHLTVGSDGKTDIYVNVIKPIWFDTLPNANMTVKIEETVPEGGVFNLLGFDLSSNMTDKSGNLLPSGGYQATTDVSAFEFGLSTSSFSPSIDLRLKPERVTTTELLVTATFNGNGKVLTTSSSRFTVGTTIINNPGDMKNNLIIVNRTKMNLTRVTMPSTLTNLLNTETDVSEAFNGADDLSANTFRNLGGANNAMHYVNLVRTELTGGVSRHVFDISGFELDISEGNGVLPKVYFPFTKYGSVVNLSDFADVSGFFSSNYDDIFIDFGYFTGVLDIKYSTIYENEYSSKLNTLRVYVLPRPGLSYTTIDPSMNVNTLNAPTWLRHSITNVQKNGNASIAWNVNSFSAPIGTTVSSANFCKLLNTYASITRDTEPVFTDLSGNVPEGNHFDVSDSVLKVEYGSSNAVGGLIRFNGVDIDNGDVSSNPHVLYFNSAVSYLRHPRLSDRSLTANHDFKIYVVDDAELVFAPDVVTNDIHMSGTFDINNITFVKYLAATGDIDLTTPEYKNTLHIIIENVDAYTIDVTYDSSPQSVEFAQRAYFRRDAVNKWSFIGIVGESSVP